MSLLGTPLEGLMFFIVQVNRTLQDDTSCSRLFILRDYSSYSARGKVKELVQADPQTKSIDDIGIVESFSPNFSKPIIIDLES